MEEEVRALYVALFGFQKVEGATATHYGRYIMAGTGSKVKEKGEIHPCMRKCRDISPSGKIVFGFAWVKKNPFSGSSLGAVSAVQAEKGCKNPF